MSDLESDYKDICEALKRLERQAKTLRWADKRPWKRKTHIWIESDLIVVDLHDLSTKLVKECFGSCVPIIKNFKTGAICFITGIGKHSEGGYSKNREVLGTLIEKEVRKHKNWEWTPQGMGRFIVITNKEKAPASATGKLSMGLKLAMVLFVLLLIGSMFHSCWPK